MKIQLILVVLVGAGFCTQQLKDSLSLYKVYDERIPNTEYKIFSNQTLTLTYDAYPGVFAMDLKKKVMNGTDKQYFTENFDEFQEDAGTNTQQDGCVAFQREISTKNTVGFLLPSSDDTFFTDIVAHPTKNKTYVVRNDFAIFEVFLDRDNQTDNMINHIAYPGNHSFFNGHLNFTSYTSSVDNNPWLILDPESKRVFVFTPYGAVSFDGDSEIYDNLPFYAEDMYVQRKRIYDVHYNKQHKAIILAVGLDGIDIYKVESGHLEFWKNYGKQEIGLNSVNIVDVDSSADGSLLYLLDSAYGFTYLKIASISNPVQSGYNIPIQRGVAFDHRQKTFFFIAQNIYNQDYAIEVFAEFEKNTYFYNRFFEDEMQLYDVVVFDFYAVLVGYDAHKLIFHSLYDGFINKKLEHHTIFTEPELVKVVEYEWNPAASHHQIVGLGKYEFKTFKVEYVHPKIKCHAKSELKQTFLLRMNATNCNNKQTQNDYSQFASCDIHHAFYLNVEEVFISTQSKIWIIIWIVFTFLIIISLGCCIYFCWKKWGAQLRDLDKKIIELKRQKYGHFNEQGEGTNMQAQQDEP